MPKVSILMPVYNAELYIAQAIESIITQTFTDWELILINDGSTDRSEAIVSKYKDNRIYYLKNTENIGLIKTLNRGIDYCGGEYIARMDADDISFCDRLEKQVEFLDKHPSHIMCGTNALVINNFNDVTGRIRNLASNNLLQINLLFSDPFVHPSMMLRRDILIKNRYDERYKHVEDYELWCRIANLGEIANLKKELFLYRWHNSNVSVLNADTQSKLKDKIIADGLKDLGIQPSDEELYCHKITFQLYALGKKQEVSIDQFDNVAAWFTKLARQNKMKRKYKQSDFIAFLWSRWAVLCISQKKYSKLFFPKFASYKPIVLAKLIKQVCFLSRK
ncbi:glycosyltransferase family 2 protein [Dysgonomonas sp. ZJ709]|uniref:glycosyltransferase family 2 protein n=1 Tax=Dysgonomonas sp. ZJ709 TaxID=2709797 RepID=UPI0013ED4002|nr:glycosyltransferase family 2 protein [Dysgonomonas sp. ZJ709]